ncbi:MAG: alpha/beta hydrolase [Alphaproteobacteria bacterium]|nr:alpha/beta hydrolase [Alphaproteobacteria bacterium]
MTETIPRPRPWPFHRRRLVEAGVALARAWPELTAPDDGDGHPVLVIPGFLGTDLHTVALRRALAARGHRVHGWGLGLNRGDVPRLLPQLEATVARLADRSGTTVSLVGWSLGGVLAREVARAAPARVRRVITLGTPIVGGAKYTAFAGVFERWMGADLDAVEARIAARNLEDPLTVPVTSIYSTSDAVVAWQASVDPWHPHVEHVALTCSHAGLVVSPQALEAVASRLT